MMLRFFLLILFCFSHNVFADAIPIQLEKAPIQPNNHESIMRGAKFFSANCLSCHTLIYLRYDKLAQTAGITYEKMPVNVKTWAFDVKPPDLTLEADVRGVDWIYTYLHSFYVDKNRPTGANNLLFPNTVMPNMLAAYQGSQILNIDKTLSVPLHGEKEKWYDILILQTKGSMTSEEFDAIITDVVNFLAYASAPYYEKQTHLGFWVIAFLILFFVLAYLLKKSYWQEL